MDEDVAQVVRSCHECQKNQAALPQAPLWWMPTLNGLKWFPCQTRHRLALSNNFEPSSRSLVFLGL